MSARFPTYFLSHGGGPWPWLKREMPFFEELDRSLLQVRSELPETPAAVLVMSGHWEEKDFTVMASPRPRMIYDFGGFPISLSRVQYPAPGHPALAAEVQHLLQGAGLTADLDFDRGFDHGTYSLLYPIFPEANVPVFQLSLRRDYDPEAHLQAGRALAPLRDRGVLIIGSGFSFHNTRELMGPRQPFQPATDFDVWLNDAVNAPAAERTRRLKNWLREAPDPRVIHPQEDHFVPLFTALGAAEDEEATRIYHEMFRGRIQGSSFRFG